MVLASLIIIVHVFPQLLFLSMYNVHVYMHIPFILFISFSPPSSLNTLVLFYSTYNVYVYSNCVHTTHVDEPCHDKKTKKETFSETFPFSFFMSTQFSIFCTFLMHFFLRLIGSFILGFH